MRDYFISSRTPIEEIHTVVHDATAYIVTQVQLAVGFLA